MTDRSALDQLAVWGVGDKFKHVKVRLLGHDGNLFAIMSTVTKALRRQGKATHREVQCFVKQMTTSKSYDEALSVVFDWVTVTDGCSCVEGDEC